MFDYDGNADTVSQTVQTHQVRRFYFKFFYHNNIKLHARGHAYIVPDADFRTKHLIKQALCKNQFLKNLNTNQISEIVDVMYTKEFEAGSYVIRKGDPVTDSFHTIYAFAQLENFQLFSDILFCK